jgi:putative PIN family toxin of toxin-antitoxin system
MAGLLSRGSTTGETFRLLLAGSITNITSEAILREVERTLGKDYFRRALLDTDRDSLLAALRRRSVVVPITAVISGVASHPEDDLVLATAVSGDANYLVTEDKQLLALGAYQSVLIVSPRDFLALLDRQKLGG